MSTKAKRHRHKYHRIPYSGTTVWACALSDCPHYMPKHMESILPGKATYCWGCETEMLLSPENMKKDKPICPNCASGIHPEDIEAEMNVPIPAALQALINKVE